jgi:hypothetical protein
MKRIILLELLCRNSDAAPLAQSASSREGLKGLSMPDTTITSPELLPAGPLRVERAGCQYRQAGAWFAGAACVFCPIDDSPVRAVVLNTRPIVQPDIC